MPLDENEVQKIARAVAARLARTDVAQPEHPALEPLSAILGISPEAARQREIRAPELRALAVLVGRRRAYRREDVMRYYRGRSAR